MKFNDLKIGDRFIFEAKTWEKVSVQGCCNNKFNSVCITDGQSHKLIDASVEIEKSDK